MSSNMVIIGVRCASSMRARPGALSACRESARATSRERHQLGNRRLPQYFRGLALAGE
jgi:hypothetical protein